MKITLNNVESIYRKIEGIKDAYIKYPFKSVEKPDFEKRYMELRLKQEAHELLGR